MPGPGAHMLYAMGVGVALTRLTGAKFSPHHTLVYTLNAFFGPDVGSFAEWLGSFTAATSPLGSALADFLHDPFLYPLILGGPLCLLYSLASRLLLQSRLLDSVSGVPLSRKQCLFLVFAGSLSHFFLDHLFEENGHSSMYTWVLSTGWWEGRAPVNPDSVLVVGLLCTCLIGGFMYLTRIRSAERQSLRSVQLILVVASLYCLWCASQIYWVKPRQAAVGEEADLGVIVFLATYFFLPHCFCILAMHPNDHDLELIPL